MSVKAFFDASSGTYNEKYSSSRNRYLRHFFVERINHAVKNLNFANKTIWDIGAGTGQLYRYFLDTAEDVDYHAVDISESMLQQSLIPAERRHVGALTDIAGLIAANSVNYFFMLGVTTYMSDDEITATLSAMRDKVCPDGLAIVTISNRASAEWALQKLASRLLALPLVGKSFRSESRVAGQSFVRNAMTLQHFSSLLPAGVHISSITELNQTFTPVNRLMPGLSVALERAIQSLARRNSGILRLLSSDLLVRLSFQ